MDKDFSVGKRQFKLGKINALKQFHIVRRMAPILAELAPNLKGMAKLNTADEDQMDAAAKFLAPIMTGISKLSDKDSEIVLFGLLESVEMKQEEHGGNWARVARDGQLLFEDLDLGLLMQVAGRAFMYNLSGFFAALPQVS